MNSFCHSMRWLDMKAAGLNPGPPQAGEPQGKEGANEQENLRPASDLFGTDMAVDDSPL